MKTKVKRQKKKKNTSPLNSALKACEQCLTLFNTIFHFSIFVIHYNKIINLFSILFHSIPFILSVIFE
jgi:hypothetical protein